ncbi:MAG: hypothetical protein GF418_12505 [Chitinivibrionales bacterium]|nr:hypothetical protein [Chitinivibrionales bacterium]MBD3396440.1 hypothetical protein [Chitinivibrionales bacterium]
MINLLRRTSITLTTAIAAVLCTAWCAQAELIDLDKFDLSLLMYARAEQIVKSDIRPEMGYPDVRDMNILDRGLYTVVGGRLGLSALLTERFSGYVCFDGHIWTQPVGEFQPRSITEVTSGGVHEAWARVAFGDIERKPFVLTGGLFNYRYATQMRDLGEYLFRSGVYPGYVFSGSEGYELLGLWLKSTAIPNMTHELFFTSIINEVPNFDLSPSYVGHVNIADVVTVGAGIMFSRLISVREEYTTPDSAITPIAREYVEGHGNVQYTHRGIKVMGRIAIDPKPLFNARLFGPEDLKLYAEAALLGTKNYPKYYEEPAERIPVMFGFHFPCFKLLDVLAIEFEYYGTQYMNDPYNNGVPIPGISRGEEAPSTDLEDHPGDADNWKWAIVAEKTIIDHLTFSAIAARDHYRIEDGNGYYQPHELTVMPGQWYWGLGLKASF